MQSAFPVSSGKIGAGNRTGHNILWSAKKSIRFLMNFFCCVPLFPGKTCGIMIPNSEICEETTYDDGTGNHSPD